MKHSSLLFAFLINVFICQAQNVGINKTNPTEALDVHGNINLSGAIKINGVAGNEGQVLASNGMGGMWWLPVASPAFTQMKVFNYYQFEQIFTVPSGVTVIRFEAWSGGGRGFFSEGENIYFSGGSGAYATGIIAVTPGSQIKLRVPFGQNSNYDLDSAYIRIDGANRLVIKNGNKQAPGLIQVSVGVFNTNTFSMVGEGGKPSVRTKYPLVGITVLDNRTQMANGGEAPFGGKGAFGGMVAKRDDNNAVLQRVEGFSAQTPGGGGAFSFDFVGNPFDNNPGTGRIVLYY